MTEVDHVVLAVGSLDSALKKLEREHGLIGIPTSTDDGPIRTAIVPFENDQYLEVLAGNEGNGKREGNGNRDFKQRFPYRRY